ncbi:DUF1338 domain-containing protein [Olivibacter sitiensis]|uniref:DUF1338 domain-containing protein n=1 Tax=Olivibacter sitiensis TaxID=376470 RepID=UPI0004213ED8|nr:DUF1338 domain-containing protein [Olivibacter sitiensis]
MKSERVKKWEKVLDGLMGRYRQRVPDVGAIIAAMKTEGIIDSEKEIENDHIAFRSLGVPHLGIASMEKIFLYYGYERRNFYQFDEKKLDAYWYSPPREDLPRIFLSELRVQDLSDKARQVIHRYTDVVQHDPVDSLDLEDPMAVDAFLHTAQWPVPTWEDYRALANESEYAAWVIYNRYYLNHYTLAVHHFKQGYNTIPEFNNFLERHGFKLNDAGGKVKQSPDGGLLQSSTVAGKVEASFADGRKEWIPGSYVEFAERRVLEPYRHLPPDQVKREYRREGFEAQNADKIFESTYLGQVRKEV